MSETSLTSAHAHVYKAAAALQTNDYSGAASESQSAAADFAKTTKTTGDSEALRILRLLEEQHQRLARTCQAKEAVPGDNSAPAATPEHHIPKPVGLDEPPANADNKVTASNQRPITAALAARRQSSQARDSSPSLARDIASRRGIPQQGRVQPTAMAQTRAGQLSPTSEKNIEAGRAPRIPPSVMDSQASLTSPSRTQKADDEFSRFYNNITTGAMSKLSTVLAFAGLPLTADDIQPETSPEPSSSKRRVAADNDPDVKKIFSKGALDAIEDEHRQRGAPGHVFGPAESFYLVQPTGGTVSYADMAKFQQSASQDDPDETFVDAPSSPVRKKAPASSLSKRSTFGKAKTGEELELENTTLKATLELLNSRLAAFETHAQEASLQAVTESVASLRRPHRDVASANEVIRQLEQQLEQKVQEEEELRATAAKQEKELRKWNKRFDALQASAKEKARAKREKAGEAEQENQ